MRKGKKAKSLKLNNSGMTLVEMIVSFVLLSIFVVSVSMLISSITNIYYNVKSTTNGLEISNLIQNKIRGELEDAIGTIQIKDEGQIIDFTKANGSHVYITSDIDSSTNKSYFVEHFYPVNVPDKSNMTGYEAVDWRFSGAVYSGYYIESLTFVPAISVSSAYGNNVILVRLTVNSSHYGTYTTEKYVKCYNFSEDTTDIIVN